MAEIRVKKIEMKKKPDNEKRTEYEMRKNENLSKEKLGSYQALNIVRENINDLSNFKVYCLISC